MLGLYHSRTSHMGSVGIQNMQTLAHFLQIHFDKFLQKPNVTKICLTYFQREQNDLKTTVQIFPFHKPYTYLK